MKRLLTYVAAAVLTMGAAGTTLAADNTASVGVVDVQQIFASSPDVQAVRNKLMKTYQAKKAQVDAAGKSLEAMMADYKKNASVMQASEREALQTKIAAKQSSIVAMESGFQRQAAMDEQNAMGKFVDQVQKAAAVVAQQRHLNLIIPMHSVVYAADTLDVTKAVQVQFNKM